MWSVSVAVTSSSASAAGAYGLDIDQMAGRIRGNTITRCDGEPIPRRTQPIRQRRRTDIRAFHLLSPQPSARRATTEIEGGGGRNRWPALIKGGRCLSS